MNAVDDAIHPVLAGDNGAGGVATLASGGIHNGLSTQGTNAPYLTYQDISQVNQETLEVEAERRCIYRFVAYKRGESWDIPGQIIDQVEALLIRASLSISGWTLKRIAFNKRRNITVDSGDGVVDAGVLLDLTVLMQKA